MDTMRSSYNNLDFHAMIVETALRAHSLGGSIGSQGPKLPGELRVGTIVALVLFGRRHEMLLTLAVVHLLTELTKPLYHNQNKPIFFLSLSYWTVVPEHIETHRIKTSGDYSRGGAISAVYITKSPIHDPASSASTSPMRFISSSSHLLRGFAPTVSRMALHQAKSDKLICK